MTDEDKRDIERIEKIIAENASVTAYDKFVFVCGILIRLIKEVAAMRAALDARK